MRTGSRLLPVPGPVLFQDAAIHHHENAGLAGLLGGWLVNDVFLHPHGGNAESDRLVDHLRDELWPAKISTRSIFSGTSFSEA